MTERTIKIKGLIRDEVCMGTYGLVELELLEIEKEMEALRQLAVSNRREQLIAFAQWLAHEEEYGKDGSVGTVDAYLKSN